MGRIAALPSSLLMSSTAHLTTDIAPVPMLWVLPLGLYLLSFVVVFAKWTDVARKIVGRMTPMFLCFLAIALLTRANTPIVLVAGIHLAAFFLVAAATANSPHTGRRRNTSRPSTSGSPSAAYSAASPTHSSRRGLRAVESRIPDRDRARGIVRPPLSGVDAKLKRADGIWPFAARRLHRPARRRRALALPHGEAQERGRQGIVDRLVRGGLSFGLPAAFAFALVWRPVRFALCLAVLMAVGSLAANPHGTVLETHRNYFGTLRVTLSEDGRFHRIVHGTALHGQQLWPSDGRHLLLPQGAVPVASWKSAHRKANASASSASAAGRRPPTRRPGSGTDLLRKSIPPSSTREDDRLFTFLSSCPAERETVLGDARQLRNALDGNSIYWCSMPSQFRRGTGSPVDARNAEMDLAKLKPDGVLALHLSNRYLDLPPIVARGLRSIDGNLTIKFDGDEPTDENKKRC